MAIFEGSAKDYKLVDFVERELPQDSSNGRREAIQEALTEILAAKENHGLEVITCLDARMTILREISVPYSRDDLIAKTIRYEAESYIHSYSIDDVIVEHLKCSEGENSSRLVMCAVPKDLLRDHLDLLKDCQIDPSVVELDATALASAFASTPHYTGEQNVLLVELSDRSTHMVLLEKDRVVKIRSMWSRSGARADSPSPTVPPPTEPSVAGVSALGSAFEEIERSLRGSPGNAAEKAEEESIPFAVLTDEDYASLSKPALTDPPLAAPASEESGASLAAPQSSGALTLYQNDPVQRLCLEIERTFAAYMLHDSIDRIVVTGSLAAELNAVERLKEHFDVEVLPFDFGSSIAVTWEGDKELLNQRGGVACGLGLRALDKGITAFDLRKGEFRFERRFEKLMPSLTVLGMLLCVLALLWGFSGHQSVQGLARERLKLRQQQAEMYEKFFTALPKAPNPNYINSAMQRLKEIKKGGGGKSSRMKNYLPAFEMYQNLVTAMGRVQPQVQVNYSRFELNPEIHKNSKSVVKFTVPSEEAANRIVKAIKKHADLFTVTSTMDRLDDGSFLVNLTLKIRESVLQRKN
ncbi:MAG: pilus assembly protein PilM [Planctomycetota bacterium]